MYPRLKEMAVSGVFVVVTTYLLHIFGQPLWGWVESKGGMYSGGLMAILVFMGLYALCGAIFSFLTGVQFDNFIAGGFLSYIALWGYLEATAGPFDSPVHIYLGILFLLGFGFGEKLIESAEQRGILQRNTVFEPQ